MQHFIKFFFRQLRDQSDKLPCTCYRALKQPVEELAMIDRILDKIKLLDAEHLELFGQEPTTGEAEKWLRRKAIVEKKIK